MGKGVGVECLWGVTMEVDVLGVNVGVSVGCIDGIGCIDEDVDMGCGGCVCGVWVWLLMCSGLSVQMWECE